MSEAKTRRIVAPRESVDIVTVSMPKTQIMSILKTLAPAISTDDFSESGPRICFYDNHVISSSSTLMIRIPLEMKVEPGLVHFADLRTAIDHASGDTISLSITKDSPPKLIMRADSTDEKKRSSALNVELPYLYLNDALRFRSVLETAEITANEEDTFIPLPDDFQRGLELCLMSSTKEDVGKAYVNLLNVKDDLIQSTDKRRASQYRLNSPLEESFQLHITVAEKLVKLPKLSGYKITGGYWVQFITAEPIKDVGRPIYAARLRTDVPYPDFTSILNPAHTTKIVLPVDKLKEPLELMANFTKGQLSYEWHTNTIRIRNKSMELRSGTGNRLINFKIQSDEIVTEDKFKISLLPEFLLAALDGADTMLIPNGDSVRHVLLCSDKFIQAIMTGVIPKEEQASE